MAEQNYANHAHRPWQSTIALLFWALAVVAIAWPGDAFLAQRFFNVAVLATLLTLIAMTRTYITRLQDRIILLEMKVRAAEILPAGEDARLAQLSKSQIVALRFAPDEELRDLLDRAVRDKLSPKEIKLAIRNWKADLLRT